MKISVRAVDEKTVRKNVTTQLEFSVDVWPDNVFCLWLPEVVYADPDDPLWEQWDPAVAHQDFDSTQQGGLAWRFLNERCEITTQAVPGDARLDLETRIVNTGREVMANVFPQNCFHFPKAPDFFCLDYSRVWIRSSGEWRTVLSTNPKAPPNFFFREDVSPGGFLVNLDKRYVNRTKADHPMIMVESLDGARTVGMVARAWRDVFHNCHPKLGCIHSNPQPVGNLNPGDTAVFQQRIYVRDGDRGSLLNECDRESFEFGRSRTPT